MYKYFQITAAMLAGSNLSMASESDPFNGIERPLADAADLINAKANSLLEHGLNLANAQNSGCDERELYAVLQSQFNRLEKAPFPKYIYFSSEIERITTPVEASIYKDWEWQDALVPAVFARRFQDPSGTVINVGGVRVGTDKFEHFSGSGFAYFESYYLENKPLREALHSGFRAEGGFLGAISTGVFSYADLSANFGGMRFWNDLLAKRPDVLGENHPPYVACDASQWKVLHPIDVTRYVDVTWDESNNCSLFRTEKMLNDVLINLESRSKRDGVAYGCPFEPERIEEASQRYGENALFLVNTEGHKAMEAKSLMLP